MKLKDVKNVGCKCVMLQSNDEALGLIEISKYLDYDVSMDGTHCVIVHDKDIELLIKEYNNDLYNEGSYNKDMISTKKVFIDLYQNFLDNDNVEDHPFSEFIESKIKEVKESKELYVIDCLVLDESVEKFSTIDELNELIKEFNI